MSSLHILNAKEKKEIAKMLKELFGFSADLPYVFLRNNIGKLFLANRDVGDIDLSRINAQVIGLYFGTFEKGGFRLSIEGTQIIGPRCTHHVFEFSQQQLHEWLRGQKVAVDNSDSLDDQAYYLVRYGTEFLGCAKLARGVLMNFVPKERRLRNVND